MSVPLLLAAAMMVALASTAQATTSVWQLIRSRPELAYTEAVLSMFPHMQLALLDPNLEATLFLPSDKVWLGKTSLKDGIKGIFNELHPVLQARQDTRNSGPARWEWLALSGHIILGQALNSTALRTPKEYNTSFGYSTITTSLVNGSLVISGVQNDARIVTSDLRAGKAIVHIVDTVLDPGMAPDDNLDSLGEYFGIHGYTFASILRASGPLGKGLLASPFKLGPTTVFAPTNAAIDIYLKEKKMTLKQLLANPSACAALVRAHVIKDQALWLWDLMLVAAAPPVNNTYSWGPLFMNTNPLAVSVAPSGLGSKVYITVGKVKAEVFPPVDPGGNDFGCTQLDPKDGCVGDLSGVLHEIDAVLPFTS